MIDIAAIKAKRVKATILSGFLGAGKTTLLNHVIRQNQGRKTAVLVNDFGKINIDSDLIESQEEYKISLTGGCICCTIQKDLLSSVINLMKQEQKPEYLIVECSGVADPSQVLNTLSSSLFKCHLHVDGLFTVIDASRLLEIETEEYRELAERQIKAANLLILNKIDLVDARKQDKVKRFIKKISPTAVMLTAIHCQIPIDLVLGFRELPELEDALQHTSLDIHVHEAREFDSGTIRILPAGSIDDFTMKKKPHDLVFESWSFTSGTPFDKNRFKDLLVNISPDIIRAKGFVYWDDPADPLVLFNLVGQWLDLDVHFKKEHLALETRLVFIGNPGWKKHSDIENQLIQCLTDISPFS